MKTIEIPEQVMLQDPNGNPIVDESGNPVSISFQQFVGVTLLTDPKFGKSMASILIAVEIKSKLKTATTKLELDNAEWEILLEVAKDPTNPYDPRWMIQLVSYLLAIKDAK